MMYEHFKTNTEYDYFIKSDSKWYYLNYYDGNCNNQIENSCIECIPGKCLPKVLIPIKWEEIDNSKPEYINDSIEDVECFVGISKRRNRISVIQYVYGMNWFVDNNGTFEFAFKKIVVFIHRSGKVEITKKDNKGKALKSITHIPFDDVSYLISKMEGLLSNTGEYSTYCDDQFGYLHLFYENQKEVMIPRGLKDTKGTDINFVVKTFLDERGICIDENT